MCLTIEYKAFNRRTGTELPGRRRVGCEGLGAEKDGFALEHLYGDEEGHCGVDATGDKDDGDGVPVICAGDEFFAEQAYVHDRYDGELRRQLDPGKHGGNGGND